MKFPPFRPLFLSEMMAALFLTTAVTYAADGRWNVDASGSWNTPSDPPWLGSIVPGEESSSDIAYFSYSLTALRTVTVDANRQIGGVRFGSTSAFGYQLEGGPLLLSSGGSIVMEAAAGAHRNRLNSRLLIDGSQGSATLSNASTGGNLYFAGGISGSASEGSTTTLNISSASSATNLIDGGIANGTNGGVLAVNITSGIWRLMSNNTFSGGLSSNAILLFDGVANPFGTGTLTLNGGALQSFSPGGDRTITNNIVIGGNILLTQTSSVAADVRFTGTVNLNGAARQVTVRTMAGGGRYEWSGAISNGHLDKRGTGLLELSGVGSYQGGTTVTEGTLFITGDHSAANGNIAVKAGATLAGTGILGGDTTIENLGRLTAGDGRGGTASLSFNGNALELAGIDTKVAMMLEGETSGSFDQFSDISTLTLNGDLTLTLQGFYDSAQWQLFSFDASTGHFDSISLEGSHALTLTASDHLWSGSEGDLLWSFNERDGILRVQTVPEPSSLFALLLGGWLFLRYRSLSRPVRKLPAFPA